MVTAHGPAATVFAVGDRVLGAGDVIRAGGWAERVVVDHHRGDLAAPALRRRQPATNPRPWGAGRLRPSATMTLHGLTLENHEDGPRLAESGNSGRFRDPPQDTRRLRPGRRVAVPARSHLVATIPAITLAKPAFVEDELVR
ncbi:hypothetical protein ACFFQW_03340 [Umezawaea endophytica]|uniref:Uncharacterized protein n=1 Tax=Umezawaea endophytica TaxID=1654476 RepID=A0A9X2VMC8_9PSEU|nr:hypothetical protein [Umezawaea endophytica]MCS7479180.1 hypothetical protein [Umezawaea endophytica]